MSVWPFSRRRQGAKLKREGAQPITSPVKTKPDNTTTTAAAKPLEPSRRVTRNPSPPPGAVRKLSKRRSQRATSPPVARPRTPQKRRQAVDEEVKEKDFGSPPLAPITPTSPMNSAFLHDRPTTAETDGSAEDITALPLSKELRTSPHLRPATQDTADIPYNWDLNAASRSHHSLPKQQSVRLQRNPSRKKRAADDRQLAKRKPSKKRKDDHLREEEIRAMSAPIAILRKSDPNDSGGLLRRESRRARSGLNRHLERPVSNISLPLEDSIHSSMSGASGSRKYRLSVFDIVAPRPTIRYTVNTPYPSGVYRQASRGESRAKNILTSPSKDDIKDRRRIDSLADDLDASELRDIMERDKRRREKKRKAEADRLQRRLERRAEKQRVLELQDQKSEIGSSVPPVQAPERQKSKEAGLGIATTAAIVPEVIEQPVREQEVREEVKEVPTFHMEDVDDSLEEPAPELTRPDSYQRYIPEDIPRMPLLSSHGDGRAETPFAEFETPMELEEPDLAAARAATYSQGRMSPMYSGDRTKASKVLGEDVGSGDYAKISKVLGEQVHPSSLNSPRPAQAEKKRTGMWSSLFRRDKRRSFASAEREVPSEGSFSNTSRESMSRHLPPAHLYQPPSSTSVYRPTAGTPVRTMSKFREDLPESPLSPPDSRVNSPVDVHIPTGSKAIAARRGFNIPSTLQTDGSSRRVSSPYGELAGHGRTDSPVSGGRASNLMSRSMASVDSEGSWLSGKPHRLSSRAVKRNSTGTASISRAADDYTNSFEELGIPDDEYFRRLNHPHGEGHPSGLSAAMGISHKASSSAMAAHSAGASDEDEEHRNSPPRPKQEGETVMHTGAGRQPTVVHREPRVKSSEGLLNQFLAYDTTSKTNPEDDYPTPQGSPTKEFRDDEDTPTDEATPTEELAPIQRATSVKLGKGHSRSHSAGSARLLDIPKRSASQTSTPGPATPKLAQEP